MASSTEKPLDPEVGKVDEEAPPPPPLTESEPEAPPPPEEDSKEPLPTLPSPLLDTFFLLDAILRVLLFASTVAAIVVLVTSSQTKGSVKTKFNQLPGLIYFVAALSVVGLWALVSGLTSVSLFFKQIVPNSYLLYFVFVDVVSLGLAASATGTAGEIGFIGLKGNDHMLWGKICSVYDKFCDYLAASVALSLFSSVVLVLLISLSVLSQLKKP